MTQENRPHKPLKKRTHKLINDLQKLCEDFGTYDAGPEMMSILVISEICPHKTKHLMAGLVWHADDEESIQRVHRMVKAMQYAKKDKYKKIYENNQKSTKE